MNKEIIILYVSLFNGNTKKIAEAMSAELKCKCMEASKITEEELSQFKYVGLGSGIYFTSPHPVIMETAAKLHNNQKAFIFTTRGCPFLGKYHNSLKKVLNDRGVLLIGEFSCKGYDCTGPYNLINGGNKNKPGEREIIRARKFCLTILPEYAYNSKRKVSDKPVYIDKAKCINCRTCEKLCLMKVFKSENGEVTVSDYDSCVHCNLCVNNCKEGAISLNHSKKELINIAKKFAGRKSL